LSTQFALTQTSPTRHPFSLAQRIVQVPSSQVPPSGHGDETEQDLPWKYAVTAPQALSDE